MCLNLDDLDPVGFRHSSKLRVTTKRTDGVAQLLCVEYWLREHQC